MGVVIVVFGSLLVLCAMVFAFVLRLARMSTDKEIAQAQAAAGGERVERLEARVKELETLVHDALIDDDRQWQRLGESASGTVDAT
jgi:hypothetical protein